MQASDLPSNHPDPDPWPDAACRGHDPDIFFPEDDRNSGPAKAICAVCPHREPCGEHALATRERFGVWGGLSESDRHAILKRRSRPRTRSTHTLTCANSSCRRTFQTTAPHAKYCSQACRNQANERLRNGRVR